MYKRHDALWEKKMQPLFQLPVPLAFAAGINASPVRADDEFVRYILGDSAITVWVMDSGAGLAFFAPHDNENTSAAATMEYVGANGGRLVQLTHSGERNVTFTHNGETYVFDPNRMFTDTGIEATLKLEGKTYSAEAHKMVRAFAGEVVKHVLQQVKEGQLIIAVHNNTNGRYSIESYKPGGEFVKEASYVF